MRAQLLLLALLFLCACTAPSAVQRLPQFDLAMAAAVPEPPRKPALFVGNRVPIEMNNELIPYGTVRGTSNDHANSMWSCWRASIEFMADAVLVSDGAETRSDAGITVVGVFGVGSTSNITSTTRSGLMMRTASAVLPMKFDSRGFVREVEASAKAAGIMEGDTIVGIDGLEFIPELLESPHHLARSRLTPGASVEVSVVRPGSGKLTRSVAAQPNPSTFRRASLQVSTDHKPPVRLRRSRDGQPRWELAPPPEPGDF